MPTKRKCVKRCRRRRVGRGATGQKILSWLRGVNKKLRSSKFLSRAGKAYSTSGLPGSMYVGKAGEIAGKLGYGRRRGRKAMGLTLAGNGRRGGMKCGRGRSMTMQY